MGYEDYWKENYVLENIESNALEELLGIFDEKQFESALDLGCGKGRNFKTIQKYSKNLTGLEPNQVAFNEAVKTPDVYVVQDTLEKFYKVGKTYDLIVAWRVLHLGTKLQCHENFERVNRMLNPKGILVVGISDIDCECFEKTKNENGGYEIEKGTILRTRSGNDVRHFFKMNEILYVNPELEPKTYINFQEKKGGSDKIKTYHGVLYQKTEYVIGGLL